MNTNMQIMKGKKGLIMGVANDKSIAWGIAQMMSDMGAELAFTYQNERLLQRLEPLAKSINSNHLFECNVVNMDELDECFAQIADKFGKVDFIIHSIAFSDKNELKGRLVDTSLENFLNTMNISCYSLIAIAKRAEAIMNEGASITTLSYYGAEKVIPNYNAMGIAKAALECTVKYLANDLGPNGFRVNAISAGPIRTLAASAIGDFKSMLSVNEQVSPLRRNTSTQDVAGCAVYLSSSLSSGTTGETIYVDSGYNILGMFAPQTSDEQVA